MAKNDVVLVDGILDDRISQRLPSDRRDEVFEYFAFEQILRDAALSQDEIKAGSVDGRDDGGIDGFFVVVNGHPLSDPESFAWPRSGCELDLWIITCKHHDTFRQDPLNNLVASVTELLDLGITNSELKGSYSTTLLKCRTALVLAYRKVSPRLNRFSVHYVYASRGDATSVGSAIVSRAEQAIAVTKELFGNCDATFQFVGAAELIGMHRKVQMFALELEFVEGLSRGERYLLLCRLSDFHKFVTDERGVLRRYLFDSNVRAFMGLNRVNEDIRETLNTLDSPDFWWLNNGITILANAATVVGKAIQVEGVQIVNGLQTTESISRFFSDGNSDPNDRSVLVKIIVSTDASVRDAIIRATNNQTAVELASLHATDKIQRDIEDVLLRAGLFYERRTMHYANQGHSPSLIVTPLYLGAGCVSLIQKRPGPASHLKAKFMKRDDTCNAVFSHLTPIKAWPSIARILKKTDAFLETVRPHRTSANERFLKNWRHPLALIAVSRVFGRFTFGGADLAEFSIDSLTQELLETTWAFLKSRAGNRYPGHSRTGASWIRQSCFAAGESFSIAGHQLFKDPPPLPAPVPKISKRDITLEFIESVNSLLPKQPWKPGMANELAQKLNCDIKEIRKAISHLIAAGKWNNQKDGIVYGPSGEVILVDSERAVT